VGGLFRGYGDCFYFFEVDVACMSYLGLVPGLTLRHFIKESVNQ
jgi:hypothetical protein